MSDRIKLTEEYILRELPVIETFKKCTKQMCDYRIEHTFRVAKIGRAIAEAEGLDVERTVIGCLLHDIGYTVRYKDMSDYRNHGRNGARIARVFLKDLGFSDYETDEICYGIAVHVDNVSDFEFTHTPLSRTIGDSDQIDRFDAYRLYEGLHTVDYMNLPLEKKRECCEANLKKLRRYIKLEFGTETATRMWREKIAYQIEFYERLLNQVMNSR